jgi:hypothetical protein
MSPEYTNLTPQAVGHKATNLNISGTPEALMELCVWAQRSADQAKREAALGRMVANAEEIGLYNEPEKAA